MDIILRCLDHQDHATIAVDVPDGVPQINVSYADRRRDPAELAIWTDDDSDGVSAECSADGTVRARLRALDSFTTSPAWAEALPGIREAVIEGMREAIAARPHWQEAIARYSAVLDEIDTEMREHDRQWERDIAAIAEAFGVDATEIEVGEQTVPGKARVRVSGEPIGYANVWDGRWLGTIEDERSVKVNT